MILLQFIIACVQTVGHIEFAGKQAGHPVEPLDEEDPEEGFPRVTITGLLSIP